MEEIRPENTVNWKRQSDSECESITKKVRSGTGVSSFYDNKNGIGETMEFHGRLPASMEVVTSGASFPIIRSTEECTKLTNDETKDTSCVLSTTTELQIRDRIVTNVNADNNESPLLTSLAAASTSRKENSGIVPAEYVVLSSSGIMESDEYVLNTGNKQIYHTIKPTTATTIAKGATHSNIILEAADSEVDTKKISTDVEYILLRTNESTNKCVKVASSKSSDDRMGMASNTMNSAGSGGGGGTTFAIEIPSSTDTSCRSPTTIQTTNQQPNVKIVGSMAAQIVSGNKPVMVTAKKYMTDAMQTTAKVSIGNTTISVPLLKHYNAQHVLNTCTNPSMDTSKSPHSTLKIQPATAASVSGAVQQAAAKQKLNISQILNLKRSSATMNRTNQPTIVSLSQLQIKPVSTTAKIVQAKVLHKKVPVHIQVTTTTSSPSSISNAIQNTSDTTNPKMGLSIATTTTTRPTSISVVRESGNVIEDISAINKVHLHSSSSLTGRNATAIVDNVNVGFSASSNSFIAEVPIDTTATPTSTTSMSNIVCANGRNISSNSTIASSTVVSTSKPILKGVISLSSSSSSASTLASSNPQVTSSSSVSQGYFSNIRKVVNVSEIVPHLTPLCTTTPKTTTVSVSALGGLSIVKQSQQNISRMIATTTTGTGTGITIATGTVTATATATTTTTAVPKKVSENADVNSIEVIIPSSRTNISTIALGMIATTTATTTGTSTTTTTTTATTTTTTTTTASSIGTTALTQTQSADGSNSSSMEVHTAPTSVSSLIGIPKNISLMLAARGNRNTGVATQIKRPTTTTTATDNKEGFISTATSEQQQIKETKHQTELVASTAATTTTTTTAVTNATAVAIVSAIEDNNEKLKSPATFAYEQPSPMKRSIKSSTTTTPTTPTTSEYSALSYHMNAKRPNLMISAKVCNVGSMESPKTTNLTTENEEKGNLVKSMGEQSITGMGKPIDTIAPSSLSATSLSSSSSLSVSAIETSSKMTTLYAKSSNVVGATVTVKSEETHNALLKQLLQSRSNSPSTLQVSQSLVVASPHLSCSSSSSPTRYTNLTTTTTTMAMTAPDELTTTSTGTPAATTLLGNQISTRKVTNVRAPSLGLVSSLEAQLARPVIPPVPAQPNSATSSESSLLKSHHHHHHQPSTTTMTTTTTTSMSTDGNRLEDLVLFVSEQQQPQQSNKAENAPPPPPPPASLPSSIYGVDNAENINTLKRPAVEMIEEKQPMIMKMQEKKLKTGTTPFIISKETSFVSNPSEKEIDTNSASIHKIQSTSAIAAASHSNVAQQRMTGGPINNNKKLEVTTLVYSVNNKNDQSNTQAIIMNKNAIQGGGAETIMMPSSDDAIGKTSNISAIKENSAMDISDSKTSVGSSSSSLSASSSSSSSSLDKQRSLEEQTKMQESNVECSNSSTKQMQQSVLLMPAVSSGSNNTHNKIQLEKNTSSQQTITAILKTCVPPPPKMAKIGNSPVAATTAVATSTTVTTTTTPSTMPVKDAGEVRRRRKREYQKNRRHTLNNTNKEVNAINATSAAAVAASTSLSIGGSSGTTPTAAFGHSNTPCNTPGIANYNLAANSPAAKRRPRKLSKMEEDYDSFIDGLMLRIRQMQPLEVQEPHLNGSFTSNSNEGIIDSQSMANSQCARIQKNNALSSVRQSSLLARKISNRSFGRLYQRQKKHESTDATNDGHHHSKGLKGYIDADDTTGVASSTTEKSNSFIRNDFYDQEFSAVIQKRDSKKIERWVNCIRDRSMEALSIIHNPVMPSKQVFVDVVPAAADANKNSWLSNTLLSYPGLVLTNRNNDLVDRMNNGCLNGRMSPVVQVASSIASRVCNISSPNDASIFQESNVVGNQTPFMDFIKTEEDLDQIETKQLTGSKKDSLPNWNDASSIVVSLHLSSANDVLGVLRDLANLLDISPFLDYKLLKDQVNDNLNTKPMAANRWCDDQQRLKRKYSYLQQALNGKKKICSSCGNSIENFGIRSNRITSVSNNNSPCHAGVPLIEKLTSRRKYTYWCNSVCYDLYKKQESSNENVCREDAQIKSEVLIKPNQKVTTATPENNAVPSNNCRYKYFSASNLNRQSKFKKSRNDKQLMEMMMKKEMMSNGSSRKFDDDSRRCTLCHQYGDGLSDGPSRLLNFDIDKWIHLNCALWSNGVYETVDGALMNLPAALIAAETQLCFSCNLSGATVKCLKNRCGTVYHLPCAVKDQCTFYKSKVVQCAQHTVRVDKENELTSLTVHRRVYIARDENGQLATVMHHTEQNNILRIGSLIFLSVGQLLPHQLNAFHTPNYIYPIGYKIIRVYWSMNRRNKRCRYLCSISEVGGRPVFSIQTQEAEECQIEYRDASPNAVWHRVLEKIAALRKTHNLVQLFPELITGEDLFGLNEPTIVRIIESLPGIEGLTDYHFRSGRNSLLELPLAINPSGSARTEPKQRQIIGWRKPHTQRTTSTACQRPNHSTAAAITGEVTCPYSKQFVHSKSSQYKKMKQEWRNNVYLARSKIQGLGLYAARDIEKHTMIIEYIGEVIRTEVSEIREKQYEAKNRGIYMFRLDEDRIVDATLSGGLARYINHSCNPNCVTETVDVDRELRIIIFAKRRIHRSEELSYDYKFDIEDDANKIPCMCGTSNCRKWMN